MRKTEEDLRTKSHRVLKIHASRASRRPLPSLDSRPNSFNLPEIILGSQDGLVNVLGVILGTAVATASSDLVTVVGLATAFAESISLAAVAYTTKLTEADYYQFALDQVAAEIERQPDKEKEEIRCLYQSYGFEGTVLDAIVEKITSNRKIWLKVVMDEKLELEPINKKDILFKSGLIGFSAIVGSLIPIVPFFFLPLQQAIIIAIALSALSLFAIGYFKAQRIGGKQLLTQGLKMMGIGMVAAFFGYLIGRLLQI